MFSWWSAWTKDSGFPSQRSWGKAGQDEPGITSVRFDAKPLTSMWGARVAGPPPLPMSPTAVRKVCPWSPIAGRIDDD